MLTPQQMQAAADQRLAIARDSLDVLAVYAREGREEAEVFLAGQIAAGDAQLPAGLTVAQAVEEIMRNAVWLVIGAVALQAPERS